MKKRMKVAAAGAIGALALGFGVPVMAQDDAASPGSSVEDLHSEREDQRTAAEQDFAERLADELGVTADAVTEALEKVRGDLAEERAAEHLAALEERLAAAVEEGTLTQDQADTLLELAQQRAEEGAEGLGGLGLGERGFGEGPGGPGGFAGPRGHHGPGHGPGRSGGVPGGADNSGTAYTL